MSLAFSDHLRRRGGGVRLHGRAVGICRRTGRLARGEQRLLAARRCRVHGRPDALRIEAPHAPERARVPEQRRRRALCARARTRRKIPPTRPGSPRPRLGFFGVIDERLDIDLVGGGCVGASGLAFRFRRSGREDRSGEAAARGEHPLPRREGLLGAAGVHQPAGTSRCCRSRATKRPASSARPRRRSTWPPGVLSSRPRFAMSSAPTASVGSRALPIHLPTSSPLSRPLWPNPTHRAVAPLTRGSRGCRGRPRGRRCGTWWRRPLRSAPEQARRHIRPTPASMARRPPRERGEGPVHVRLSRRRGGLRRVAFWPNASRRSPARKS